MEHAGIRINNQLFAFRTQTDFWSIPALATLREDKNFRGLQLDRDGNVTAMMQMPLGQLSGRKPSFDITVIPTVLPMPAEEQD